MMLLRFYLPAIGFLILLMMVFIIYLLIPTEKAKRINRRLHSFRLDKEDDKPSLLNFGSARLGGIGDWLAASPLIGLKEQAKIAATLSLAGWKSRNALSIFVGMKGGFLVLTPFAFWGLLSWLQEYPASILMELMIVMGSAILGWKIPDFMVGFRMRARRRQLAEGMADALDLLVICVEAGLGLEQALDRVSRDIGLSNPVVGEELSKTVSEIRISPNVSVALYSFAERSRLPMIKSLVGTLVQSLQYGTSLTQSLRVLSAEMRQTRMLAMEERAARLPVLMTMPLILCILPCLFIVIGGAAVLQATDTFHGTH